MQSQQPWDYIEAIRLGLIPPPQSAISRSTEAYVEHFGNDLLYNMGH